MTQAFISSELMEFIRSCLKSVWSLELLLLIRLDQKRRWTVAELTRELRASESLVSGILHDFLQCGLVIEASPAQFEYRTATPALDDLVKSLAGIYAERPGRVVNAIANAQHSKVQSFANAFQLRRGKDSGD